MPPSTFDLLYHKRNLPFSRFPLRNVNREVFLLDAGVSTVDRQCDASDIGRIPGRKEDDRCVELSFVAVALHRDRSLRMLLEEFAVQRLCGERCIEVARTDRIDGDAILPPFCSQCSGQVDNAVGSPA